MNPHLERALALMQQNRVELAEKELGQALIEDPHDAMAHSLLARCLAHRNEYDEATRAAHAAIAAAPEFAFCHATLAAIYHDRNRFVEAEQAIRQAIELDPSDADNWALLAQIELAGKHWQAALEAAETGLEFDSEHVDCLNLQSLALIKLGRRDEAGAAAQTALARDPENADTHVVSGWRCLEQGQTTQSLHHFREALRLEPENELARSGIVEALKSKHVVYRIMLGYFFWMARLSDRAQWIVILGGWFGIQFLNRVADENPSIATPLYVIIWSYVAFALMTWLAPTLFNTVVRLSRDGRLALTRKQRIESDCVGVVLLAAIAAFVAYAAGYPEFLWLGIPLISTSLFIPSAFTADAGWPRNVAIAAASIVLVYGLACFYFFARIFWVIERHAHAPDVQIAELEFRKALELFDAVATPYVYIILVGLVVTGAAAGVRVKR